MCVIVEHKSTDNQRPSAYLLPPRSRSYLNDNDKLQGAYDLIAKIKAERERKKSAQVCLAFSLCARPHDMIWAPYRPPL
jgi:hypothetical protein